MALELFKVDSTDYTNNIINESYEVQDNDVYQSWTDANFITHREKVRTKVEGKFTMRFRSLSTYQNFVTYMASKKTTGSYYPCSVYCNNTRTKKTVNLFVTWAPKAIQRPDMVMDYGEFDVTISEV